jgi:hypothetical protein
VKDLSTVQGLVAQLLRYDAVIFLTLRNLKPFAPPPPYTPPTRLQDCCEGSLDCPRFGGSAAAL